MHPLLFEDPTKHMKLGYTNSLDLWIFHCVKDNTPNKLTCKWCDKMIHCIHYHPLILLWLMHFICHTLCFILSPPDWRIPQKKLQGWEPCRLPTGKLKARDMIPVMVLPVSACEKGSSIVWLSRNVGSALGIAIVLWTSHRIIEYPEWIGTQTGWVQILLELQQLRAMTKTLGSLFQSPNTLSIKNLS